MEVIDNHALVLAMCPAFGIFDTGDETWNINEGLTEFGDEWNRASQTHVNRRCSIRRLEGPLGG